MLHAVEHYAVGDGDGGGCGAYAHYAELSVEVVELERGEAVGAHRLELLQLPAFGLQLG